MLGYLLLIIIGHWTLWVYFDDTSIIYDIYCGSQKYVKVINASFIPRQHAEGWEKVDHFIGPTLDLYREPT